MTDYEGTVFLGGKQFRDFPRTARLRYVTHVDGASGLVAASVRENLQMADLSATEAILYCLGLIAVCAIHYVIFSVSTLYYVGYPLLIFYWLWALRRMKNPQK